MNCEKQGAVDGGAFCESRRANLAADETNGALCSPASPRRRRRAVASLSSIFLGSSIICAAIFPSSVHGFVPDGFRRQHIFFRRQHQQQQLTTLQRKNDASAISRHSHNLQHQHVQHSFTHQFMSTIEAVNGADLPSQGRRMSTFQKRMYDRVLNERIQSKVNAQTRNGRPSNVKAVNTLEDYKTVVGNEKDKVVVVRFYATWCKACRAMAPYFYKLAQTYKDIQFVEVPVTEKNANLHQGLGVPSLPYGHVYHPESGLVEELKINKKYFPKFARVVHSYAQTSCDLLDGETSDPYPDPDNQLSTVQA